MTTMNMFGGGHSEQKLDAVEAYLEFYTKSLRNKFELHYVDAFSGCGHYNPNPSSPEQESLALVRRNEWREGSALRAMKLTHRFHQYIFMEKNERLLSKLRGTIEKQGLNPDGRVQTWPVDANEGLRNWVQSFQPNIRTGNHLGRRAVCFLDPYGLQVEWETLECLCTKEGIDIWILIPSGHMISRAMPNRETHKTHGFEQNWEARLDCFFGSTTWRDKLYQRGYSKDLWGNEDRTQIKKPANAIEQYTLDRLETLPVWRCPQTIQLCDAHGNRLFSLLFMMTSPNNNAAVKLAERVVEHIISKAHRPR